MANQAAVTVGGPMFEPAAWGHWKSVHDKTGAHYNTFAVPRDANGMDALRELFPKAKADTMNFVLFSTSGVHGTYATIEEAAAALKRGNRDEDGDEWTPSVTFLVVQPRIVCLRYGNCYPQTAADIAFLKKLRASSWRVVQQIGKASK